MKRIDLGQVIQIVANLGVIAGIVMIAIELRLNNELLGVQIRANSLTRIVGTADAVLQSPDLLDLLGREEKTLTLAERDRLVVLGIRSLTTLENAFEEVERGLGDEARLRRVVITLWNRPRLNYGMPLAWESFKPRANPRFVAWMEENVIKRGVE